MKYRLSWVIAAILLLSPGLPTYAAGEPNKGLAITPLRQYIDVNAGNQKSSTFTVSNLTPNSVIVQLFDKQFSVANYTYDYKFNTPQPDLVTLDKSSVTLKAGESQKISYTVTVPSDTTPGGQYYTLFASASIGGDRNITVQAATLLYVTVNGLLSKTTELNNSTIQHLSFGGRIGYHLEPSNTGNVHYFIYVHGELKGFGARPPDQTVTHILLPGSVRNVDGDISPPRLPGIYKATYGYQTDSNQVITRSAYIAYVPLWFVALLLLAALGGWLTLKRRNKQKTASTNTPTE